MCGIAVFYARESVPDELIIDKLMEYSSKRGTDGVGFAIVDTRTKESIRIVYPNKTYAEVRNNLLEEYYKHAKIGTLFMAISRAAPEEEPPSTYTNMQPICSNDCIVIHNGSVTQQIYDELVETEKDYTWVSQIDSEAIIAAYYKHGKNIKNTCEYLSGGFAAVLYDKSMNRLFHWTDFKPVAHMYIRGVGYAICNDNQCFLDILDSVSDCSRNGINMWEDFYNHYLPGGMINSMDLDSGFTRMIPYNPRYITQSFDSKMNNEPVTDDEELCLVSCSGGFDSTMTLAVLKYAGYKNIVACHFKYGHRGQTAEEIAIKNITDKLGVSLKVFDIENLMRGIDETSMLIDENAKITTGTREGLKRLDAWVCGRNLMFTSIVSTYAESLVMKYGYKQVYLLGGFLNLSESSCYPDNAEYFINSALELAKYGTLTGNRIKPLYGLSNLMKSDLYYLMMKMKLQDVYSCTISCDRPIVVCGLPCNCSKNGLPACGSGLLTYWAGQMVGIDDMQKRNYYVADDATFVAHAPQHMADTENRPVKSIEDIVSRILIPEHKRNNLLNYINTIT